MFSSLHAFHIDGVIAGRLKKQSTDNAATNRDSVTAEIIPFAQRDIVDRFLHGIDPEFEDGICDFFSKTTEFAESKIFDGVGGLSKAKQEQIIKNMRKISQASTEFFRKDYIPKTKKRFRQQTEDMVLFMAKQELANLGEALVNITSIKRKFSAEKETVAGPIDVAVISKNDGFVWVKRKHYFKPELNPRYFFRKFGSQPIHNGGEHDATS